MKIFVFDTETTGFIDKKIPHLDKQPYIVQFAGILGDLQNGEFKEISRIDQMIKPKIHIPFSASKVNNIYDIDVKDSPSFEECVDNIMYYINSSDAIIGHNLDYDLDMIKLELKRLDLLYEYNPPQLICTMKNSVDYCAIDKGNGRFKYPRLGELYKKIFGEYFIGAHDAIVDVEATLKCFLELNRFEIIKLEKKTNNIITLF